MSNSTEDLLHRGIHQREKEGERERGEEDDPGGRDLLHRGIQATRVINQQREEEQREGK